MAQRVDGGRFSRMAKLAGVAARTTADVLTARAKQKLTGQEADVGDLLRPTAERLVDVLGDLKGAATKVGQFISLVDQDTFPEEARKALTKLLNQTPPRLDPQQVQAMVREELGGDPLDLYTAFELVPFAAASMGQVHAATTKDGQDVVVKIQFPGVDAAIEADLRNAGVLAKTLQLAAGSMLDAERYYDEIAATLRRELDYLQEIEQAEVYAKALLPWPDLVVPTVRKDLSTRRVLTMERLRGPTMLQAAQDEDTPTDVRNRVGRQLVAATWGPFLNHHVIHADPHPGNYIVMPDGRLGVLDFGATKVLSPRFVDAYRSLLAAAFAGGPIDYLAIVQQAGFTVDVPPERASEYLNALGTIVERPFRTDFYDWGQCRIAADVQQHTRQNTMTALRVRAPEESLMFYRSAAGAAGDLRMLRSAGNFRQTLLDVRDLAATARAADPGPT
jgi:predicted unusual protein kinase regulating ubiquinone biosynthesis (AarF/ABC1/UbiB family)